MFSRPTPGSSRRRGSSAFFGVALAPFFGNMGANGAFAWISDAHFRQRHPAGELPSSSSSPSSPRSPPRPSPSATACSATPKDSCDQECGGELMSIGWPDLGGCTAADRRRPACFVAGLVGLLAWDARRRGPAQRHPRRHGRGRPRLADGVRDRRRVSRSGGGSAAVTPGCRTFPSHSPGPSRSRVSRGSRRSRQTRRSCARTSAAPMRRSPNWASAAKLLLELGEILGIVLAASPALLLVVVCAQAAQGHPFLAHRRPLDDHRRRSSSWWRDSAPSWPRASGDRSPRQRCCLPPVPNPGPNPV